MRRFWNFVDWLITLPLRWTNPDICWKHAEYRGMFKDCGQCDNERTAKRHAKQAKIAKLCTSLKEWRRLRKEYYVRAK